MTQPAPRHHQFEAIGTRWAITLYQPIDDQAAGELFESIARRIEDYDKSYSRFRKDSLVAKMSEHAGIYRLPEDAPALLDIYQRLYRLTDGAVTPLVGNLLAEAGYDAGYSLNPGELHNVPPWEEVLDYRYPELTLKQPALLDFGAAGKGYLVDIVAQIIEDHGIAAYVVDAGGDIRQRNVPPQEDRIGLEHPVQPDHVIGVAIIGDQSLCGSSGNRRTWGHGQAADGGDLHHIMDPRSRQPVRDIAALWTVAPTAIEADALATALFFVPPATLQNDFSFEYLILYDTPNPAQGLREDHSASFPAELFFA